MFGQQPFEPLRGRGGEPRSGHARVGVERLEVRPEPGPADPLQAADAAHAQAGRALRRMLRAVVELDRTKRYREEGARDTAHLLQMRYGLSGWKARRMVQAAHALERLPRLSEALEEGRSGRTRCSSSPGSRPPGPRPA